MHKKSRDSGTIFAAVALPDPLCYHGYRKPDPGKTKGCVTMRIEHIAMYVNDLEGARNFFVTYFGAVSNEGYHNPKRASAPIFCALKTAPGWS